MSENVTIPAMAGDKPGPDPFPVSKKKTAYSVMLTPAEKEFVRERGGGVWVARLIRREMEAGSAGTKPATVKLVLLMSGSVVESIQVTEL